MARFLVVLRVGVVVEAETEQVALSVDGDWSGLTQVAGFPAATISASLERPLEFRETEEQAFDSLV